MSVEPPHELRPHVPGSGDRAEIEALIPHRAPFLFVDRILERSAAGLKSAWRVPEDASWFRGHYPGMPVTPGVILSEHTFQSAALHVSLAMRGFKEEDGVPVLTKISSARFKRMVGPGEELVTEVALTERLGPAWIYTGLVRVDGRVALRNEFVLSATDAMASLGLGGSAAESR